ncbi:GNAT family N-acetyltransferase [Shimia sp. R10_1]|uniref:GNAT family N-acetyltransferase n=1 Tax=Shimia sp. R10_1 TaxID=2821095 RepID=UPI001ADC9FED|nr:GNAT family N-acetyltransferase [Shimia sp. R10_1]
MTDFLEAATVGKAFGAVIINKQTGEIVGWFKIDLSETPEVVGEFGYWIGEAHQRKGYAYEITRGAFDFAFHVLNVTVMRARARLYNDASLKLLEKLGMTCVGSERFWTPARERYEDCTFWEYEKPRR